MRRNVIFIWAIVILSIIIGIYFYGQMPEQMASHWNAAGEVDGYMSKAYGLFLMPAISLGLVLLFLLIPKIDPLKKNIEKFRDYYEGLIIAIMLFLFYIYLLTIFANLGYRLDMTRMLIPAIGVLFYFLGVVLGKARRNWFIGIKTPWTLSSDKVWDKTHKLGGKLFKVAGVIALVGFLIPAYAIWIAIVPILIFVVYLIFYSYFEYNKPR